MCFLLCKILYTPLFVILFEPELAGQGGVGFFPPLGDFFSRFVEIGFIGLNLYEHALAPADREQVEHSE